jgi:hypothetical protein
MKYASDRIFKVPMGLRQLTVQHSWKCRVFEIAHLLAPLAPLSLSFKNDLHKM